MSAIAEASTAEQAPTSNPAATSVGQCQPTVTREALALATHPDPQARSGAVALLLARQACRAPGGRTPEALDALAAALAETGQFEEAARTAREAAALARAEGNSELAAGLEQRQRLYEARQPYRMSRRW